MTHGGIYSATELGELSTYLGQVEDWLRQDCSARHAEDMADLVHKAWNVIDDLYDQQIEAESACVAPSRPESEQRSGGNENADRGPA